jgi:hypothetical protein
MRYSQFIWWEVQWSMTGRMLVLWVGIGGGGGSLGGGIMGCVVCGVQLGWGA